MFTKKILSFILCAAMLLTAVISLAACNAVEEPKAETEADNTDAPTSTEAPTNVPTSSATKRKTSNRRTDPSDDLDAQDVTKFDLAKYLSPVWDGNISYAESAFVRESADGSIAPISLLYPIEEIISVRSADLMTTYINGEDYYVDDDGNLVIIPTGNITVLAYDEYYFPLTSENYDNNATKLPAYNDPGYGYIRAEISNSQGGMTKWQIAVTYTHSAESVIEKPIDKSDSFAKLITKLECGEDIKIVSTGDSITDGWSSSDKVNMAPYCPRYNLLVEKYIEATYDVDVTQKNVSVSGSSSGGGVSKLADICAEDPDLVIIAFGMNDGGGTNPANFVSNINTMVNTIKEQCPDACVVVVGSALPNEKITWSIGGSNPALNYHDDYPEALIEAEENWTNAAFANVTKANIEMVFESGRKVHEDLTGSNSNHPNDYMHRIYAQVIIQTMFGDYVTVSQ